MAEPGHEMDVDSHSVAPPQGPKPPRPWEKSKIRETLVATLNQMLEPIRQVVREEISSAMTSEQSGVSGGSWDRG